MANPKLLLIQDVEDLGRSGDLVSVRPGYARNFLFPKKLAVPASANTLKMQAKLKEERNQKALVEKKESEELAAKMAGLVVETFVKVDHDGHMYGSVSSTDIAHLIEAQHSIVLEKRFLQLKHPIKEVGVFEIPIKLKEGILASVSLKVIPEESKNG